MDVKYFTATLSFSVYFFYEREYFQCMKRSVLCLTLYLVKNVRCKYDMRGDKFCIIIAGVKLFCFGYSHLLNNK